MVGNSGRKRQRGKLFLSGVNLVSRLFILQNVPSFESRLVAHLAVRFLTVKGEMRSDDQSPVDPALSRDPGFQQRMLAVGRFLGHDVQSAGRRPRLPAESKVVFVFSDSLVGGNPDKLLV